jgi:hypothetical protein
MNGHRDNHLFERAGRSQDISLGFPPTFWMNMTKMRSEVEGLFHACHDQSGRGVVTRDVADRPNGLDSRIEIALKKM